MSERPVRSRKALSLVISFSSFALYFFLVISLSVIRFLRLLVLTRKGWILCGVNAADIASSCCITSTTTALDLQSWWKICTLLSLDWGSKSLSERIIQMLWSESVSTPKMIIWTYSYTLYIAIKNFILNCSDSELSFSLPLGFGWFGKSATPCN